MTKRVRAKKNLGQHFLNDTGIAMNIARCITSEELPAADSRWGDLPIVEIGPGMGVLTSFLLELGRPLKAVELDSESVGWLKENMPQVDVVEADFLKIDLSTLFPGEMAIIGNYPYNISSQIFFKVLENREKVPVVAGMLQKEVAERICAGPGGRERGILSVFLQAWYDCEYLFTVPPTVFSPPPKVQSGVLRLVRNSRTSLGCDEKLFKTVVKTAFGQRRKTLRNSLGGMLGAENPVMQDEIMGLRPERLNVEDFVRLTNAIRKDESGI